MRPLFRHPAALGFLSLLAACSNDDGSGTAAAPASSTEAALPSGGAAGTSSAPALATAPTAAAGDATDAAALQPALPVTENPDHDALLASTDPQLAANKRLVYDLWRTLIDARDTTDAAQYLAEGYIQHNPNADTGRAGVLAYFSSLGAPQPVPDRIQEKLVAIVAERDFVAIAQVDEHQDPRPYTTTWVDLFRIQEGLIAEHWDHGELAANASPRGYVPPTANPDQPAALASDDPALAANKLLVSDTWRILLDAQQVEEAPKFLAPGYIQHNPLANTGLAGFLAFFRQFAQPRPVQPEIANFIQIVAEKDLVVLATLRSETATNGTPYATTWFDMFRVQDGLLAEHWDTTTIAAQ